MTPKEDQQPMTTREEALAKAAKDFIDKVDRGEARSVKSYAAFKAALRLASRQEVSVTVEEIEKFIKDKAYPTFDDWEDDFARALLAKYSITKRTTEG